MSGHSHSNCRILSQDILIFFHYKIHIPDVPYNICSGNHPIRKKDYKYYAFKDIEMAKESDYGIMIWDGESKGTLNNINNLLRQNKQVLVYYSPEKIFRNIKTFSELNSFFPRCHELSLGMIPTLFSELQ